MKENKNVLVGVLKSERDRNILLREKWYRIPCSAAPKRVFQYLAFYQPACFGREGKRIQYYARVLSIEKHPRRALLPQEQNSPNANAEYCKIFVSRITKLSRPIKNAVPRRISFGFTTLARLKKARTILELYNVAPIEEIVKRAFDHAGIPVIPQYPVSRFRLDFAILFSTGKIAIECDNIKAHSSPAQRKKDRIKDVFLRYRGWKVIRLKEAAIIFDCDACLARVRRAMHSVSLH